MKHIKTFNSINELRRTSLSGTMAGSIESLEDKKYELKKDVKGAKIGDFINVVLPKGTIIHNLPGGVFADHSSLKNKYTGKSSQGPEWFDKPTFKGVMIKQMPDTLAAIEKNSKVLESAINEGSRWDFSKAEIKKAAETLAKAMAKADKVKVEVHDFEYDKGRGAGFELSYDGDKYDGGSYYIKPNGDVINAAIKGGTKYGNVKSSEKDYLKYFKANESVTEGNLMKDLKKIGAQIDYLSDADDETQKIWKKAGINPKDDDTIILYSYVNSWPETKKILKKSKIDYKELEDPNSAGESFIVFKESTITEGTLIDLRLVNENVNDEIEQALMNWLNTLADGNAVSMSDLYLDNGILLGTVAKEIKQGREEIQRYFEMFLKKSPIGSIDTFILQNFGDVCISDGTYTFEIDGEGGNRESVAARYTYVWKKENKKWMIATHHSSVNPK